VLRPGQGRTPRRIALLCDRPVLPTSASARTVRDMRTVLRSALSQAMREELIAKNVAAWSRHRPVGRGRRKPGRATRRASSSSQHARAAIRYTRCTCSFLCSVYAKARRSGSRGQRSTSTRPRSAWARSCNASGVSCCIGRPRPRRQTPRSRSPVSAQRHCGSALTSNTCIVNGRRGLARDRSGLHRPLWHAD
jgi:hypothetical protein